MSRARLNRLDTEIAPLEHALAKLAGKKGGSRERAELSRQLAALRRQRDAEAALQDWIRPREDAHA